MTINWEEVTLKGREVENIFHATMYVLKYFSYVCSRGNDEELYCK